MLWFRRLLHWLLFYSHEEHENAGEEETLADDGSDLPDPSNEAGAFLNAAIGNPEFRAMIERLSDRSSNGD